MAEADQDLLGVTRNQHALESEIKTMNSGLDENQKAGEGQLASLRAREASSQKPLAEVVATDVVL